jgi:hypothetical protein
MLYACNQDPLQAMQCCHNVFPFHHIQLDISWLVLVTLPLNKNIEMYGTKSF